MTTTFRLSAPGLRTYTGLLPGMMGKYLKPTGSRASSFISLLSCHPVPRRKASAHFLYHFLHSGVTALGLSSAILPLLTPYGKKGTRARSLQRQRGALRASASPRPSGQEKWERAKPCQRGDLGTLAGDRVLTWGSEAKFILYG